ncbi:MAG: hypothetical protein K6F72_00660 [Bacteroidales bacterium]|nr:hypothetical protein [Bacteroidales bacterium]
MPGSNTNTIDPELLKKQQQEQQVGNAASEGAVATQPITVTPAETVETPPSESQRYLDQIFAQYEERKKQNAEADKRDRVREAIGGIGDVASALAKMHYTTQYAPYVPSENLSDKARQRYEKAKANRDANLDQWMHYVLNVAGKKQAAEQAAEHNRLTKEYHDQQAKIADDKAKAAAASAEAKARAADIKEGNKTYLRLMMAALRNGEYDRQAAIADLDAMRSAGLMEDDEYKARIKVLDSAEALYKDERSKINQKGRDKAAGGKSGGNYYEYIAFADGSGVNINKNDTKTISAVYNSLPEEIKSEYPGLKADQRREAVVAYLATNRNEAIENYLRQVSRRQTQPSKQQQSQGSGKYSSVNKKGGKTDYTHVNKK